MNANQQIVALYDEGMSVEDICQAAELDEVTVKMALTQGSAKYNLALQNNTEEFSNTDKEMMKQVLKQLALGACEATPNVRFRAAKFIYEEKKGRNDVKGVKNVNVNIIQFKQAMAEVEKAVEKAAQKVIDIPSQFEHMKEITA